MNTKLIIETVPINSIFENPMNARVHEEKQLLKIAASLKRFGQQLPLIVGRDSIIIVGNGRYRAASTILKWLEIDIIRTKLDANEAKAYGITDNQLGVLSDWDLTLLGSNIQELYDNDPHQDWDSIGFEKEELIPLLENLSDEELEFLGGGGSITKKDEDVEMAKPIRVTKEQREIIDRAILKIRYQENDSQMSEGRCCELAMADYLSGPD